MKKVMIGLIIIAIVIGGGIIAIRKHNENLAQVYSQMEKTAEVKQGNLSVNIVGSGNIELKNPEDIDLNELKVKIDVDELDIGKISIGQDAEVKVSAFPNEVFNGKVIDIDEKGETINGVTTYKVEISLPNIVNEVGKINSKDVKLKQGPSKDYMTIKTLDNGTDINILSRQDKWYEISLIDGSTGWIYSDYINVGSIDKQDIQGVTINESTEVRKGASTNYGIITKLSKDNKLSVIDKNNNWYKIKLANDQEGWVQGKDINIQKLKHGMSVTASILIEEKKDVLYIPVDCINKTDEGYIVDLKGNEGYKIVQTGIVTDDYIEITDGLSVGDKVKVLKENDDLNSMY